jgi:hypothetical protein
MEREADCSGGLPVVERGDVYGNNAETFDATYEVIH